MSADDPLDEVTGSISDGDPVDWELAESSTTDAQDQASLQALRDIERVALGYRVLHESPAAGLAENQESAGPRSKLGQRQWGELTVLELVRMGASGEVWRAWDPWLQREVALKFLQVPKGLEAGAASELPLLDEARALARIRHPGIVAVHGIAEHGGRVGMWMEFLEGATLASEIERRGPLPWRQVAQLGLDLCRALEAVEGAGVVHRDIKPANVVLENSGRAVLTDFGLGRRWELGDRAWGTSGTPVFMSPGALAGGPATPRTDIYALGVTLRWALTGHSPFKAQSFEELEVEAKNGPATPLAKERPDAPAALVAIVDRAMAPDAEQRYTGAAPMAADLEAVLRRAQALRFPGLWSGVAGIAGVFIVTLAVLGLSRLMTPRGAGMATRFSVMAPPRVNLDWDPENVAVSPDGLTLAFVARDSTGTGRIWVRPLNALAARPLEGTASAEGPFWSPDSRNLGFFSQSKLKRISLSGGLPEVICPAPDGRGGTWGKNGQIVFAPVPTGPLARVSAEGGPVTVILEPDSTRQETALRWPEFLPDGKHFLFVSLPAHEGGFDVFAGSIGSKERKLILRAGTAPVVAGKNMIIFARDGQLVAQRIDFATLRSQGIPMPLGPSTASDASVGERVASASWNGVLAHHSVALPNTQLFWLDRSGRRLGSQPVPEGRYEKATLSPDGRRLLVVRRTSPAAVDLWMIDLATGSATRLSYRSQSRIGGIPVWSPDGHRVAFSSSRDGPTNIYVKDVEEETAEQAVYQSPEQFKEVDSWSPDGRYLFFDQTEPATGWDLWMLPMQGERRPIPYHRTRLFEASGCLSPDGKWICYVTDETGTGQIYVEPFPTGGETHRISISESALARWSSTGREVVLFSSDRTVWSVPVVTSPTFRSGTPTRLFKFSTDVLPLAIAWTPDFSRFLVSVPVRDVAPPTITVEMNWPAEAAHPRR